MDKKKIFKGILSGMALLTTGYVVSKPIVNKKAEANRKKLNIDNPYLREKNSNNKPQNVYTNFIKDKLDSIIAYCGIVALSPVLLGISAAIYIDDPGPVFFKQKRIGKNKEYFELYKFRSMKMSTPHDVPTHMLENPEQYITRIGRWLRKSSCDELAQLFNIFNNQMSIIGPRPALWNQDDLITERDKYGANDVKPGLTGWAQINGRDELEIPVKAKLDGDYIKAIGKNSLNAFSMDLNCFFGTVLSVLKHDGVVEGGTGEMNKKKLEETPNVVDIVAEKTVAIAPFEHINVLICGKDSYIGTKVKEFLLSDFRYSVTELDMLNDNWKTFDFSSYDVVFHVAGIAHKKETSENSHLYYEVNRDLAFAAAQRAKQTGVKRFIFMSSMSVYGVEQTDKLIDLNTVADPTTNYGESKLQGEQKLAELEDDSFNVAYLRLPMVYGEDAPGNLDKLFKAVKKIRIFPIIENSRSSISIDNLCDGVRQVIEHGYSGIIIMQDSQYRCTTEIIREMSKKNEINVKFTRAFNPFIYLLMGKSVIISKVFGNLKYSLK